MIQLKDTFHHDFNWYNWFNPETRTLHGKTYVTLSCGCCSSTEDVELSLDELDEEDLAEVQALIVQE